MISPNEASKDPTIDLEIAKKLIRQSNAHDFGAYSQITDEAAEFISKYDGESISLNGLTELSDAAAESLSKYRGDLLLCNLRKLSDAAAESLSKHE